MILHGMHVYVSGAGGGSFVICSVLEGAQSRGLHALAVVSHGKAFVATYREQLFAATGNRLSQHRLCWLSYCTFVRLG